MIIYSIRTNRLSPKNNYCPHLSGHHTACFPSASCWKLRSHTPATARKSPWFIALALVPANHSITQSHHVTIKVWTQFIRRLHVIYHVYIVQFMVNLSFDSPSSWIRWRTHDVRDAFASGKSFTTFFWHIKNTSVIHRSSSVVRPVYCRNETAGNGVADRACEAHSRPWLSRGRGPLGRSPLGTLDLRLHN
jgi:hypothetical protein